MSASGIAANVGLVSGGRSDASTMSPDDDILDAADVIQLDDNRRNNLHSILDDLTDDDKADETILVQSTTRIPEITLPKTSLISALSGEDNSWSSTPLIRVSSTPVDVKTQLKSISNIVQSNKGPNTCSSSNNSKVSADNNRVKTVPATPSDGSGASQPAARLAPIKTSSKSHFRDPNIIKSSSGHHHNNGYISKPLVINHSTSVDNIVNHNDIQPTISTLSSQLIFSSIITTQAKSLSSVQIPRANTQQQQTNSSSTSPAKTTLVMSNRSTSSSSSSPTSATTTSTNGESVTIKAPSGPKSGLAAAFTSSVSGAATGGTAGGHAVSARLMDMGKKLLDAAREGQTDHVRQLVVNSGAPFTSDWLGTTALHLAAQYGHTEIAEILLRGGVNRDARTKLERTALHLAAQGGWIEVVDLLLIHGADTNVRDMLKMTPLHWAVERGHVAVVERLLFSGADANAKSKFHLTPIDIAQNSQSYEMMDLFRNWIHKNHGGSLVSYIGLNHTNNNNNNNNDNNNNSLSESHDMLDVDYHHLHLDDNDATTSRNSVLDVDEPCIDLVELEWNALKFEPDFFLTNDDEDEPKVEYLMKIVEELQKENRQLRQRVEQLSMTSQ